MRPHLAKEAARLKNDDTLNKALDDIRSEALNSLAIADADNYATIVRWQQRVAVVDEIRATLDRYVLQGSEDADDVGSPYA